MYIGKVLRTLHVQLTPAGLMLIFYTAGVVRYAGIRQTWIDAKSTGMRTNKTRFFSFML